MRGLALLGMLAWHAQIGWVKGGFARMTIFFVLAGFLAASSQLRLLAAGDAAPFLTFWGRRARRLLPVTVLGVLASIAATAVIGGSIARQQAVGDTASVLFSFSNWRFILGAREYGAMFETSSAFQHYWSLSVEEQCFVALPLLLAAATLTARRFAPARAAAVGATLLAALGAVLAAVPLFVSMSSDAAYYSTVVRGGEFLAGAALALWWSRARSEVSERGRGRWDLVGLAGLATLVVVMLTMERDAAWLYRGGMGLFALPAVAMLAGVVAGGPMVNRLLGVRPLRDLGRWAFPIYVLHWPLFLVMDEVFDGAPRTPLVVFELVASIALGALVHHRIERPLMPPGTAEAPSRATALLWGRPGRAVLCAAVAVATCLLAAAAVPTREPELDFAGAEERSASLTSAQAAELLEGGRSLTTDEVERILGDEHAARPGTPVLRDPARQGVAVFGGSTALMIALGGEQLTETSDVHQAIPGYSPRGCGLLDAGVRGDRSGAPDAESPAPVPEECRSRDLRWAATAIAHQIDVALVAASLMETVEWQLPGDDTWRTLGDPVLDAAVADALRSTVTAFGDVGVERVLLLTRVPPPPSVPEPRRAERVRRQSRYAELVREATDRGTLALTVLNAGVYLPGLSWEVPLEQWELHVRVNLWGVVHGIRAAVPVMVGQGRGHVVAMASGAGLVATPGLAPYVSSKHAVVGLMESVRHELARAAPGVKASVVCPGNIRTPMTANTLAAAGVAEEHLSPVAQQVADTVREGVDHGVAPETVADSVLDALNTGRFWVLPQPEVALGALDRVQRIVDGREPVDLLG